MIVAGIIMLTGSWVPLLAAGLLQPAEDPLGLSLLAILGSLVGVALVGIGGLRRSVRPPPAARR